MNVTLTLLVLLSILISLCISVEFALVVGIGVAVTYCMCSFALPRDRPDVPQKNAQPPPATRSARRTSQRPALQADRGATPPASNSQESDERGKRGERGESGEDPENEQPTATEQASTAHSRQLSPTYRTHDVVRRALKPLLQRPPDEGPLSGRLEQERLRRGHEPDARTWASRMAALQDSMAKEITTGDAYIRPLGGGGGCKIPLGTF